MPTDELRSEGSVLVESERLLIRCLEDGELRLLERIFCDPVIMHYLGEPWTEEQAADSFREWRDDWGIHNCWHGVLLEKASLKPVGTAGCSADTIEDEPGLELSWFLLPEFQKRGFATEITSELLRFAFNELGAQRAVVETHPDNPASNRVLEKLNFTCLGIRQNTYKDLPGFTTQVLWELTQETWRDSLK